MLRCDKCGATIPGGSKFCPQCADRVTAADSVESDSTTVALVCPKCKAQQQHSLSDARVARLTCTRCKRSFTTTLARVRGKRSRGSKKHNKREFSIRIIHGDGGEDLIEFVTSGHDDFELRSKDWAAFSYVKGKLRVVQNLTVGRYMEISNPACVVATFVFGEDSPEVRALRQWRDDALLSSRTLATCVDVYYWLSPIAIRLAAHSRALRIALVFSVRLLTRRLVASEVVSLTRTDQRVTSEA